jgi:hypothetical protein
MSVLQSRWISYLVELLSERSYVSRNLLLRYNHSLKDPHHYSVSLGTGRPLMLRDDDSVRNARELL